jgi:hypothetical protein
VHIGCWLTSLVLMAVEAPPLVFFGWLCRSLYELRERGPDG